MEGTGNYPRRVAAGSPSRAELNGVRIEQEQLVDERQNAFCF